MNTLLPHLYSVSGAWTLHSGTYSCTFPSPCCSTFLPSIFMKNTERVSRLRNQLGLCDLRCIWNNEHTMLGLISTQRMRGVVSAINHMRSNTAHFFRWDWDPAFFLLALKSRNLSHLSLCPSALLTKCTVCIVCAINVWSFYLCNCHCLLNPAYVFFLMHTHLTWFLFTFRVFTIFISWWNHFPVSVQ